MTRLPWHRSHHVDGPMGENATILRRRPSASDERKASRSGFRLPPELLKKARRRLSFLAGMIALLCVLSTVIEATIGTESSRLLFGVYLVVFTISTLLWLTHLPDLAEGGLRSRVGTESAPVRT